MYQEQRPYDVYDSKCTLSFSNPTFPPSLSPFEERCERLTQIYPGSVDNNNNNNNKAYIYTTDTDTVLH